MDTRPDQALLRAEISSRISIPQPKETVKAKAKASALQFASEIQISVNHNVIKKKEFIEGAKNSPHWLKEGTSSPRPTPIPQTCSGKRNSTTTHIGFLLWSVLTARIRVMGPLPLWDTADAASMRPHLHTHVKLNKALHHIQDSLFPESGLHLRHCRQESGTPNGNPWRKCASRADEFRQDIRNL
ncbi:hypothetical protein CDAR_553781 [Caerostris darwini]|uniref:Uncharacterized protein n=1 Tax=Caerostris darwini TaxID=1538125 RepID=A0AAV4WK22_9ARAC|nr:hypothetical protein CDAR_553781 [Caerostris darwini]